MNRVNIRGLRWWVLPMLLMLCFAIYVATRLGVQSVRPAPIQVELIARETADYGPWEDDIQFNPINPRLGTLIAEENRATANALQTVTGVPQLALNPTQLTAEASATTEETAQPTATPTPDTEVTETDQANQTATDEAGLTETENASLTETAIVEATQTAQPTATSTPTPSATATPSVTATPTVTTTPTPTVTPIPPTPTLSPSPVPPTNTASPAPSSTPRPTSTPIPTLPPTVTSTVTITNTPIPTNTFVPTPTPRPPIPFAAFGFTQLNAQAPYEVQFNNQSTGQITSYLWTFGDGTTSTQANPTHSYATSGFYAVTLTVIGPGGSDIAAQNINISDTINPPVANFTSAVTSGTLNVQFNSTSSGIITSYAWSFGDGNTSNAINPTHNYAAPGTYAVSLTVRGPGGTDTATVSITLISPTSAQPTPIPTAISLVPDANFTASVLSGPSPLAVNFTNLSSGQITGYIWNFGDGIGTSTQLSPAYTFNGVGNYVVTLTVNGPGGSDTHSVTIQVTQAQQPPNANFQATVGLGTPPATLINFTNLSTGDITTYFWDFGDGAGTSSEANPSYSYTTPGNYTVTLTVTGPAGTDTHTEVITIAQPADLNITLSVDPVQAREGDTVTYTMTANNPGTSDATGVFVSHDLPTTLNFVGNNAGSGLYSPGLWSIGALPAGQSATLTVTFTVRTFNGVFGVDTINMTATVTSVEDDPNTANNTAFVALDVVEADVALILTVNDNATEPGDTVIFTITARNNGGRGATGVSVSVPVATPLIYISDTGGGAYNSGTGTWTVGNIAANNTRSFTITAQVPNTASPQTIRQTASVNADQYDSITGNNTRHVDVFVEATDLRLSFTVDNPTPFENSTLTYTVTVTNNGPMDTGGVVVVGMLPGRVTYAGHNTVTGTYTPGGSWSIGTLAAGQSATLTLQATVNAINNGNTTLSSTAGVSGTLADYAPNNNTVTIVLNVPATDLLITNTVRPQDVEAEVGDEIRYTLTVQNIGPTPATNVIVADLLPAEVTYAADNGGGAYSSGSGIWTIGNLPAGGTASLNIRATVNPAAVPGASFTNTATVTSNEYDTNEANNTASAVVNVPQAPDLAIALSYTGAAPNPNETINLTVSLTNNGPGTATNINVGSWVVPSLAAGQMVTNPLAFTVPSMAITTTNASASINSLDQTDPNLANNTATLTLNVRTVDMSIVMLTAKGNPSIGDTDAEYTVTVSNKGTIDATNIVVTGVFPAGLDPNDPTYTFDPGTRQWTANIPTLAAGVDAVISLTMTVTASAPIGTPMTTTLTVDSAEADPDPSNNSDSAPISVITIDRGVSYAVGAFSVAPNGTATLEIVVQNNTDAVASDVQVTTVLPSGINYDSHSAGALNYTPGTGVWDAFNLGPSGSRTLFLTVRVLPSAMSGEVFVITTTVSNPNQPDPVPGNDSADATITVP